MEMEYMEDRAILKAAMKERKVTQTVLADRIGIRQNALSANINRNRMGLDNFKQVLNALGYDVAVIDRETGETRWLVDTEK